MAVAGVAAGTLDAMIRLLIADDQDLIRSAFAALLGLEPDFEVVATVARGDEVIDAARKHRPDVALLDIEMDGIDGLTAAGVLAEQVPGCRALILPTFGRARADSWSRTLHPSNSPRRSGASPRASS